MFSDLVLTAYFSAARNSGKGLNQVYTNRRLLTKITIRLNRSLLLVAMGMV